MSHVPSSGYPCNDQMSARHHEARIFIVQRLKINWVTSAKHRITAHLAEWTDEDTRLIRLSGLKY